MDTQSPSESYQITFDVQRKKFQHCLIFSTYAEQYFRHLKCATNSFFPVSLNIIILCSVSQIISTFTTRRLFTLTFLSFWHASFILLSWEILYVRPMQDASGLSCFSPDSLVDFAVPSSDPHSFHWRILMKKKKSEHKVDPLLVKWCYF